MGCCSSKPIQGAYRLSLVRGDETIDLGIKQRPIGYVVGSLGADYIRAKQFGSWDVYAKVGHNKPEHRGVLTLTPTAVDFDQKSPPLS